MIRTSVWDILLDSLWDDNGRGTDLLPGTSWLEWMWLSKYDYDDVDYLYIDHEVIGGD